MTTLNTNVREWYHKAYETDDIWEDIVEETTFRDVYNCLQLGEDVYDVLTGDSIVRERVFSELLEILGRTKTFKGITYDDIYDSWIDGTKINFRDLSAVEEEGFK